MGIQAEPLTDAFQRAVAVEGGRHSLNAELLVGAVGPCCLAARPVQPLLPLPCLQLKILGLDICADTAVGGQMLRGVSGGQKKRVTSG